MGRLRLAPQSFIFSMGVLPTTSPLRGERTFPMDGGVIILLTWMVMAWWQIATILEVTA